MPGRAMSLRDATGERSVSLAKMVLSDSTHLAANGNSRRMTCLTFEHLSDRLDVSLQRDMKETDILSLITMSIL
jgi:hypothetical protein